MTRNDIDPDIRTECNEVYGDYDKSHAMMRIIQDERDHQPWKDWNWLHPLGHHGDNLWFKDMVEFNV